MIIAVPPDYPLIFAVAMVQVNTKSIVVITTNPKIPHSNTDFLYDKEDFTVRVRITVVVVLMTVQQSLSLSIVRILLPTKLLTLLNLLDVVSLVPVDYYLVA